MGDLEAPLRLLAFEYRRRLEGGLTRPLLVGAYDNDGTPFEVVLKLRHPDTDHGHFGPTSLACELVCSVLARAVGIAVPDYFIVDVSPEFCRAIPDRRVRELLLANVGENFATFYLPGMARYEPGGARASAELVDALEHVLAFDATVFNGDRKARKPNLLRRGDNLYAIDHSVALPMNLWPAGHDDAAELFPDEQIQAHCGFAALQGKARRFEAMLARWSEGVSSVDLQRLRSFVPAAWETASGQLDRIFTFLEHRPPQFDQVGASLRRVVS